MQLEFVIFASGFGVYSGEKIPKFLTPLAGKPLLEQQLLAVGAIKEVDIIHVVTGLHDPELDRILESVPARGKIIFHRNPEFRDGESTGVLWQGELPDFPPPLPKSDSIRFCRGNCQHMYYRFLAGSRNDFLPLDVYCAEVRRIISPRNK